MASLSFGHNSKPESSIGSDTSLSGESANPEAGLFKMEFLDFGALRAFEKIRNLSPVELPSVELASAASARRSESAFSGHQMQTLRRELIESEGVRSSAYYDSRGIRTVGIGFNLERADAPLRLKEVGADFKKVFEGSHKLSAEQIEKLFKFSLKEAIAGAGQLFPNLSKYSFNVKKVLVDMVFNMGVDQVREFKNFGKAIKEGRFWDAGHSLRDSLYYQQVGRRAVRNEFLLKGAGKKTN